nr:7940_t:CDS:2 [Entrophospora candida]
MKYFSQITSGNTVLMGAKTFEKNPTKHIFVIGGREIYQQTCSHADYFYVSVVKGTYEGNIYFPFSSLGGNEKQKSYLLEKLFEDFKLIKKEEFPDFVAYVYKKGIKISVENNLLEKKDSPNQPNDIPLPRNPPTPPYKPNSPTNPNNIKLEDAEKFHNQDHVFYFSKNNDKFTLKPYGPDHPEPVPSDRKEGKFDYVTLLKEKNIGYCHVFRNINGDVDPQDWRVIYVSEKHPEIKRLLREGKLQENKQFTIRYGKADKEEQNL